MRKKIIAAISRTDNRYGRVYEVITEDGELIQASYGLVQASAGWLDGDIVIATINHFGLVQAVEDLPVEECYEPAVYHNVCGRWIDHWILNDRLNN